MTITFAAILFAVLLVFGKIKKNTFYILHAFILICLAYFIESNLGIIARPFSRGAFLMFALFHIPLINIITFIAYGRDKSLAKRGQWRIPEIQLHTLELLGGTIGAVLGQKFFKHKCKKKSYKATFYATVVIQFGIMYFILKFLHIW